MPTVLDWVMLAHPEIENAACVVIGTGMPWSHDYQCKLHRGRPWFGR